jgi:hypothetical protein
MESDFGFIIAFITLNPESYIDGCEFSSQIIDPVSDTSFPCFYNFRIIFIK